MCCLIGPKKDGYGFGAKLEEGREREERRISTQMEALKQIGLKTTYKLSLWVWRKLKAGRDEKKQLIQKRWLKNKRGSKLKEFRRLIGISVQLDSWFCRCGGGKAKERILLPSKSGFQTMRDHGPRVGNWGYRFLN